MYALTASLRVSHILLHLRCLYFFCIGPKLVEMKRWVHSKSQWQVQVIHTFVAILLMRFLCVYHLDHDASFSFCTESPSSARWHVDTLLFLLFAVLAPVLAPHASTGRQMLLTLLLPRTSSFSSCQRSPGLRTRNDRLRPARPNWGGATALER